MIRVIYASRLMKGWEVRKACQEFREQEAAIRRARFRAVKGGIAEQRKRMPATRTTPI